MIRKIKMKPKVGVGIFIFFVFITSYPFMEDFMNLKFFFSLAGKFNGLWSVLLFLNRRNHVSYDFFPFAVSSYFSKEDLIIFAVSYLFRIYLWSSYPFNEDFVTFKISSYSSIKRYELCSILSSFRGRFY